MIVGFTGKAQSGKDTAAGVLIERFGFERFAFADPMREAAEAINPLIGFTGYVPVYWCDAVEEFGYETTKDMFPEARRFLQRLGTEYGRNLLGGDHWVNIAFRRAGADMLGGVCENNVVFTDVRFENEAARIRFCGGIVVQIVRPDKGMTGGVASHASETEMDMIVPDAIIRNDGDMAEFVAGVTAMAGKFGL